MPEFSCLALHINRDCDTARNDNIRQALKMTRFPYERLPAIREDFGQLGCLKSRRHILWTQPWHS